jgi:hypothetical protein
MVNVQARLVGRNRKIDAWDRVRCKGAQCGLGARMDRESRTSKGS